MILLEKTTIPNRNVFIVGSPGSGKTQSYILSTIIFERNRSMVISAAKGEWGTVLLASYMINKAARALSNL